MLPSAPLLNERHWMVDFARATTHHGPLSTPERRCHLYNAAWFLPDHSRRGAHAPLVVSDFILGMCPVPRRVECLVFTHENRFRPPLPPSTSLFRQRHPRGCLLLVTAMPAPSLVQVRLGYLPASRSRTEYIIHRPCTPLRAAECFGSIECGLSSHPRLFTIALAGLPYFMPATSTLTVRSSPTVPPPLPPTASPDQIRRRGWIRWHIWTLTADQALYTLHTTRGAYLESSGGLRMVRA
ncbi:hypothetical protein K438DRAFT_1832548 [Mycena galopus ATCC 62051]|nr:hypothetical protein K438DRAFT_1832548 [Mycena galopus ATCC 62051]